MSADKRSTHTDALATLGTIITDGGRDAIHLAVEPVEAGERLVPGQHIGVKNGKAYSNLDAAYAHADKHVGIVDPFIKGFVMPGEKFWLIVYPRQITSLRHVWEHPDFEVGTRVASVKDTDKSYSEKWLRDWCERTDDAPTYEDLIAVMTGGSVSQEDGYGNRWSNEGDHLLSRGRDASGAIPLEVWVHVESVTGKKLDSYPSHFSCSC